MSVISLTSENFEEILGSGKPILIDFYATWCGPCKMMAPVVEEIAEEHPEVTVCKINTDDEPAIATSFGIMAIPTFVAIKDGAIKGQLQGVRPKAQLTALFE